MTDKDKDLDKAADEKDADTKEGDEEAAPPKIENIPGTGLPFQDNDPNLVPTEADIAAEKAKAASEAADKAADEADAAAKAAAGDEGEDKSA